MKVSTRWAVALIAIVLMFLVLRYLGYIAQMLSVSVVARELRLPLLAVGGAIALLITLAIVAVAFAGLGLTDPRHALALPEGSVRAVVALLLVTLFAVIAMSLYASLDGAPLRTLAGLRQAELDAFLRDTSAINVIQRHQGTDSLWTVLYRQQPSAAAADFARQLLAMVGTLVTSVASFYFATRSTGPAPAEPQPALPSLSAVTPQQVVRGTPARLTVSGRALLQVTEVRLERGTEQVAGAQVLSSESQVECEVRLPAGAAAGPWDVVVRDARQREARLPQSVTVT